MIESEHKFWLNKTTTTTTLLLLHDMTGGRKEKNLEKAQAKKIDRIINLFVKKKNDEDIKVCEYPKEAHKCSQRSKNQFDHRSFSHLEEEEEIAFFFFFFPILWPLQRWLPIMITQVGKHTNTLLVLQWPKRMYTHTINNVSKINQMSKWMVDFI